MTLSSLTHYLSCCWIAPTLTPPAQHNKPVQNKTIIAPIKIKKESKLSSRPTRPPLNYDAINIIAEFLPPERHILTSYSYPNHVYYELRDWNRLFSALPLDYRIHFFKSVEQSHLPILHHLRAERNPQNSIWYTALKTIGSDTSTIHTLCVPIQCVADLFPKITSIDFSASSMHLFEFRSLTHLTHLESMTYSITHDEEGHIEILAQLQKIKRLTILNISRNELDTMQEKILSTIATFPQLEFFRTTFNLHRAALNYLQQSKTLKTLEFSVRSNRMPDDLFNVFALMQPLQELTISTNITYSYFVRSKKIFDTFSSLQNLRKLNLQIENLPIQFFSICQSLHSLRCIKVAYLQATDDYSLGTLAELPHLTSLSIESSTIAKLHVEAISRICTLQELHFKCHYRADVCFQNFSALTQLEKFSLYLPDHHYINHTYYMDRQSALEQLTSLRKLFSNLKIIQIERTY